METVDGEIFAAAEKFLDNSVSDKQPFFVWFNTTRMHVWTHLKKSAQGASALPLPGRHGRARRHGGRAAQETRRPAYEKASHESGMYIGWYGDNIWLFVPAQQRLKDFLVTLPEFPFQEGSSLNAGNINYNTLKAAGVLKRLRELESLSPPSN